MVHVEWRDSHSASPGWKVDVDDWKEWLDYDCPIHTVGIKLGENDLYIFIAQSIGDGTVTETIKIPLLTIIKIKVLGTVKVDYDMPLPKRSK
jgi:hypothetical protein